MGIKAYFDYLDFRKGGNLLEWGGGGMVYGNRCKSRGGGGSLGKYFAN